MRAPLPEFKSLDISPGLTCSECGLSYVNADHLNRIKLADAELIFCMQCSVALAVIPHETKKEFRKSA